MNAFDPLQNKYFCNVLIKGWFLPSAYSFEKLSLIGKNNKKNPIYRQVLWQNALRLSFTNTKVRFNLLSYIKYTYETN